MSNLVFLNFAVLHRAVNSLLGCEGRRENGRWTTLCKLFHLLGGISLFYLAGFRIDEISGGESHFLAAITCRINGRLKQELLSAFLPSDGVEVVSACLAIVMLCEISSDILRSDAGRV